MPGEINWCDLTIPDANALRDFYQSVVGWNTSPINMGGYEDYCMNDPATGKTIAGICHARGANAGLPPQWLIYFPVANLDESMNQCTSRGGAILHGPRDMGSYGRMCVIRDPAGAVAALIQPVNESALPS